MRRPSPSRQQGFGLLVFVIAIGVVAFSFVIAYSGVWTRKEAMDLQPRQEKRLDEAIVLLERAWPQWAWLLDDPATTSNVSAGVVVDYVGIPRRGGLMFALSRVLTQPSEGLTYRAMALYYPSESDDTNPPDIAHFIETGVFNSCSIPSLPCSPRAFRVFNSLDIERELLKETTLRLNKVALKAQFYFKARMLQDPERNVSVNYFYKPLLECSVSEVDLGCMPDYTPLVQWKGEPRYSDYTRALAAKSLALTDEELFTAWGEPIEASNVADSVNDRPPYAMSFRGRKPTGGYIKVKAVQPF